MQPARLATLAALGAVAVACVTAHPIGPAALQPSYLGFNEAIANANDQQLLLNLVRLRYRDSPLFLEVGSVVAQNTRTVTGSLGAELVSPGADTGTIGVAGSLSESPVVTLIPLKGPDYAKRLLEPIDPRTVIGLSFAGWSLQRLLVCCVQELAGLRNAESAAGPTPALAPPHGDFQRVAALLRRLQVEEALRVAIDEHGTIYVDLGGATDSKLAAERDEVLRLLEVPAGTHRVTFGPPMVEAPPGQLTLMPRSLLAIMYFLSQGVDVPEEHERAGLVTVTHTADGARFDWDTVLLGTFHVHSGVTAPAGATLRVRHRGFWFWIDDADLESKTTFNLLSMLLSLRSAATQSTSPLLAIGH